MRRLNYEKDSFKYMSKNEHSEVVRIGRIDIDAEVINAKVDNEALLVLPTRNLVLFPGVTIPISIGREKSLAVARRAEEEHIPVGVVCQRDASVEAPAVGDLYDRGVSADVLKVIELPDGTHTAIVRGRERIAVLGPSDKEHGDDFIWIRCRTMCESEPRKRVVEYKMKAGLIGETAVRIVSKVADEQQAHMLFGFDDSTQPRVIINVVSTQMHIDPKEKYELLCCNRMVDRADRLLEMLMRDEEKADLTRRMMERARGNMEQNQKNVFLHEQMEAIRSELYGDQDDEISELVNRADSIELPAAVRKTFDKEVERLRRFNPQSPDYSTLFSYIDTLLSLPWNKNSELNNDFAKAREVLESDHYGLDKVKERILEQMAMLMDNPDNMATIICLVGPPGVGKTSLGQSVARALGRKFSRISLGGVSDEAEIRGHRRTYIGAMPGRIIDAVKRAGTSNPVIMLDELDKIGADYKGDPAAALLEVLDPEQNCHFHDNYIDVDFDLSKVLFIATANTLSTVSRPLLDRIEVIEVPGYLVEEKIEIARRHLLPRLTANVPSAADLVVDDDTLQAVIEDYTSESGVRQLEKRLGAIVRKRVLAAKSCAEFALPVRPEHLKSLLGTKPYIRERYEGNEYPGVVTGLAWTQGGGAVPLARLSSLSPGKGERLTLTGNLGNVMKESAQIAVQWVRAHAGRYGIESATFDSNDIHIHFPEGAIPKDGPSAGITMVTSIVSALTGRKVRERIAMTGEMTLRGKVLPVGGIKEKILAAKRAGITDIVLSSVNRKDIEDIAERYVSGLTFHYVDDISEVLDYALLPA